MMSSLSVRVGNAGAGPIPEGVIVAFYEGNPAAGGQLLGTVTVSNLEAGKFQDVMLNGVASLNGENDIYAIVDSDNQIIECNEANNNVMLPVLVQTTSGNIEVGTDEPLYGPQSTVVLQGAISNSSALPGEFESELRIEDMQGTIVASFTRHHVGPLAGGSVTQIAESWNTASLLAGTYRLRGLLYSLSGVLLDEAVSEFEIAHSTKDVLALNLRTTTDKPLYHTTDTVQIENLLQNLTSNMLVNGAELHLSVLGPSGIEVFGEIIPLGELLPHAQRKFNNVLQLSRAVEGGYQVKGLVVDSAGQVLASDLAHIEIKESLSASLAGAVTAQFPVINYGEQQVCNYAVENLGVQDYTGLTLRQTIVAMDTLTELDTNISIIDLVSGATSTGLDTSFNTQGYEIGHYSCILQAQIEGAWVSLANAFFELIEPPINISATLGADDRGRVLVLLDDERQDCTGITDLGLENTYATPLGVDATVEVQLFDQAGALVDTETTVLDTRTINQQFGTDSIDLIIDDFSATHLAVTVNGAGTLSGKLGAGYQVVATVTQASGNLALDSGLVVTDCGQTLSINDIRGDYRVATLGLLEAANDPLGPNHTPDLFTQRAYLENLLQQTNWSYTIVTNKDNFAAELHTGGYVNYLLLSEQIKLDEQVQKELREAVYRGEGLVEAGGHDQRQGRLDEALGIKFIGKHSDMSGVAPTDSALHAQATGTFGLIDRQLRTQLEGATALGYFKDTTGATTTEPAITDHGFGNGRSLHVGFDLLAEAALAGGDNLYGELILAALSHVHPATINPVAGLAYPIKLTLTNEGIATLGRARITLPAGVTVADTGSATLEGTILAWPFDLAETGTQTFTAWLILPEGAIHLDALIQTGIDPDFVDHVTAALDITPQAEASVTDALNAVVALNSNQYKQVKKYLQWAEQDVVAGDHQQALSALTRASDALIKIGTAESGGIRLMVAEGIRLVSRRI